MNIPQAYSYHYRPSPGNRLTALALSLAVCALIVFLLIRMGVLAPGEGRGGERLTAISLQSRSAAQERRKAATARAPTRAVQAVPRPPQEQPKPVPNLPWLKLSRQDFAASDISKLPKRAAETSGEGGPASPGSAGAYGPGEGPGGARLYNAQWYREPTRAELVTYMPHRDVAGGWAMIACKTQERFRVEDCRELGESPPGSGLARALRLAAWQFLVRPPRLDGKPMIGAWVRIRFDFTRGKESDGADQEPKS